MTSPSIARQDVYTRVYFARTRKRASEQYITRPQRSTEGDELPFITVYTQITDSLPSYVEGKQCIETINKGGAVILVATTFSHALTVLL